MDAVIGAAGLPDIAFPTGLDVTISSSNCGRQRELDAPAEARATTRLRPTRRVPSSVVARTALEGRDGRLFLSTNADLDVLRLHTDSGALREEVVAGWAGVLRRRRERFAQSGIAYLTLVTPAAHVVY